MKFLWPLFLFIGSIFISAQTPPSLENCFKWALQNNIEIEVTKFNPQIATEDIKLAESPFQDIFLTGSASYTKFDSRLTQSNIGSVDLTLAKRFLPGTEVAVNYNYNYESSTDFEIFELVGLAINDDNLIIDRLNTAAVTFQVTQPLLRNFGIDYNSAFINIAKKQKAIAEAEVQRQINDTLTQVEIAYWTWISLLKSKQALEVSVMEGERYKRDYVEPKAGLTEGVLPSDVDQAIIDVQKRLDELIGIEKEIKVWEDKLKRLIFPPYEKEKISLSKQLPIWEDGLNEFQLPIITSTEDTRIPKLRYDIALKHRPELKQAKNQIEAFGLLVQQKENQLLPEFNLVGSYTFLGQAQAPNIAMANVIDGNHYQWKVGVEFEYTFGNFGASSDLRKTQLQEKQSQKQLKQIEYDICLEIKLSRHEVEEAVKKYDNITSVLEKAKERLVGVERRYLQPSPYDFNLIFFVQDAEIQRTEAQINQYRSILQYKIAMAQLKHAQAQYIQEVYQKYIDH